MKFAVKISLSLVGALVANVAAVSTAFYFTTARLVEGELRARAMEKAADVMVTLERFMFERLQGSKIIASSLPFKEESLDLKTITRRLIDYRNEWRMYSSISFYDPGGKRLADTSGLFIGEVEQDRFFFKEAMEKGASAGSEVGSSASDKLPVVYFSSAVRGNDGKDIGVVVERVPLYKFRDMLTEAGLGPGGEGQFQADILDGEGLILFSTRKGAEGFKSRFPDDAIMGEIRAGKKMEFTPVHDHKGIGRHFNAFAVERGYLDYKGNGWAIVLWIPEDYISGPLKRLRMTVIAISLLMVIPLALFSSYLSRLVSRPLEGFVRVAREIGEGHLDVQIEYEKQDEFGDLAGTLRKMAGALRGAREKLEGYAKGLEEEVRERAVKLEASLRKITDQQEVTLSILEDTNEVKAALEKSNAELTRAQEKLQELDRLKDEFISSASHELRTPLTTIKNAVSNAIVGVDGEISESLRRHLLAVDGEVDRLTRIVGDLLDISKIEARKVKLRRGPVDMAGLLMRVVETFRPTADAKSLHLETPLSDQPVLLLIDSDRITQVIVNLVGNAIKFTPKGGRVAVAMEDAADEVRVSVKDTGIGIARRDFEVIFERFGQIHRAGEAKTSGTGLGLAITRQLIEMHGGRIWVESEEGKGSTFTFAIPKRSESKEG